MKNSFENFLREKFAAQYNGLDDEMPEVESEWFIGLEVAEFIAYAEQWHAEQVAHKPKE